MKKIIVLIFMLFCLDSFSQTFNITKKQEPEFKKYTYATVNVNSQSLFFDNNIILSYNFNNKKNINIFPLRNFKYLYRYKNSKTPCMWCFLAPALAGVLYYQSYISFKNGSKTDGYVALGLGTGLTVFSLYYFFNKK